MTTTEDEDKEDNVEKLSRWKKIKVKKILSNFSY
jgi:hypothetical protein